MAHLNRRDTDDDDGKRHRVLELVESTQAKAIARILVPLVTIVCLPLIGFFGIRAFSVLDATVEKVNRIDTRTQVMDERMNNFIVSQIQAESKRNDVQDGDLRDHTRRLEQLERTVKLP